MARSVLFTAEHLGTIMGGDSRSVCINAKLYGEACLKLIDIYEPNLIVLHSDDYIEAEALGVELDWQGGGLPIPVAFASSFAYRSYNTPDLSRFEILLKSADRIRSQIGSEPPIFLTLRDPFSLTALTLGIEKFFILLMDDPDKAKEWIEFSAAFDEQLIECVTQSGFHVIIGSPIACCGIVSREHFLNLVFPFLRRIIDTAAKTGGYRSVHWCSKYGIFNDILPLLALDLLSFEKIDPSNWQIMSDTIPMGGISAASVHFDDELRYKESIRHSISQIPRPFVLAPSCFLPAGTNHRKLAKILRELSDDE